MLVIDEEGNWVGPGDGLVGPQGEPGEQATMFFYDPSGNAIEFKSFQDFNQILGIVFL